MLRWLSALPARQGHLAGFVNIRWAWPHPALRFRFSGSLGGAPAGLRVFFFFSFLISFFLNSAAPIYFDEPRGERAKVLQGEPRARCDAQERGVPWLPEASWGRQT